MYNFRNLKNTVDCLKNNTMMCSSVQMVPIIYLVERLQKTLQVHYHNALEPVLKNSLCCQ